MSGYLDQHGPLRLDVLEDGVPIRPTGYQEGDPYLPYSLAEGSLFAGVVMRAILDAGAEGRMKPSKMAVSVKDDLATVRDVIDDAMAFLYDPQDHRRYWVAEMAGIPGAALDKILSDVRTGRRPVVATMGIPAAVYARLRERAAQWYPLDSAAVH